MEGSDFSKDLEFGEDFEQRAIKLLSPKYEMVKKEGYHPPYDLVCSKTNLKVECKSDRRLSETGNIIIEKGALEKCQADIFLYEDAKSKEIYYAEWPELKYWVSLAVELGEYQERVVGENNTLGYIIPLRDTIMYMSKWRVYANQTS